MKEKTLSSKRISQNNLKGDYIYLEKEIKQLIKEVLEEIDLIPIDLTTSRRRELENLKYRIKDRIKQKAGGKLI